jgi:hypothetical protein
VDNAELDRRATLIVDTCGGIHPPYEAFYIHSILYSSSRALDAFQRFSVARRLNDEPGTQVSCVHEALGHAAALSRFFWPSGLGKASKAARTLRARRASKLRAAFKLTSASPLKDRRLRDSLEHFDERLDRYLLENDAGAFFPEALIGDSRIASDPSGHVFKLVDPVKHHFVCMGEVFYYGDLEAEVTRVHEMAQGMSASGSRLHPKARAL